MPSISALRPKPPPGGIYAQTNKEECSGLLTDDGEIGSAIDYPSLYAPVDSPIGIDQPSLARSQSHMLSLLQP